MAVNAYNRHFRFNRKRDLSRAVALYAEAAKEARLAGDSVAESIFRARSFRLDSFYRICFGRGF